MSKAIANSTVTLLQVIVQKIQGGEFGKPDREDLELCGKIHEIIETTPIEE